MQGVVSQGPSLLISYLFWRETLLKTAKLLGLNLHIPNRRSKNCALFTNVPITEQYIDAAALAAALQNYLAEHPRLTIAEDDEVVFDLPGAHYSVSGEHGKCLLHLWSSDRNLVRRVLSVEESKNELTLTIQRFGQAKPNTLHLMPAGERSAPGTRASDRAAYRALLKRVLSREFPDYKCDRITSAIDLEHSLGPVYARGSLHRGNSAIAVVGVGSGESQTAIDNSLTTGLLWLSSVREHMRQWAEGLLLVVPAGRSDIVRARMASIMTGAGRLRLFEFNERDQALHERDFNDGGNIRTRLVQAPDPEGVLVRFAEPIAQVRALLPDAEISTPSTSEIVFRYRGLEFARSRIALDGFRRITETVFGLGAEETALTEETHDRFAQLVDRVRSGRQGKPEPRDPLWRISPERWLESLVVRDVAALDPRLDSRFVYSQVPAFAASDRAMIDVLTCTRDGRLAVLELKASEDFHLPLQGLDYWSRVRWHHERGEFKRFGYFAGRELSDESPLLYLVAPALHIHPETDTLLKFLSPEVDWELIAVDERWREALKVVFRKHGSRSP